MSETQNQNIQYLYSELNSNPNYIRNWAKEVISFSSEYNNSNWAACNVTSTPKVYPSYGDIAGSWGQGVYDANQFIELRFPLEVYPTHVNIYETYNCGAVVKIKIKNKENEWITVWQSENGPEIVRTSRIFSPNISNLMFKSQEIRLELDCSLAGTWCEIDCVELIGKRFSVAEVNPEKTLSDNMLKLLEDNHFSDVDFEVEGKIVKGHRNILASRSSFLKNILTETTNYCSSKPVHIENISYKVFQSLMFYLYTGKIEANTSGETVCELIRASEWYDLEDLNTVGYFYIKENISLENVLLTLVSATEKQPKLERVEKACLKFLAKNFNVILNDPNFKKLNKNVVIKIAQFYGKFFEKRE